MGKKDADPDKSQQNKEGKGNEEKIEKKDEATPKPAPSKETSLNMPTILAVVLTIGLFVSVAASYGVQRYRDVYVIPPQKEQTFPFVSNAKLDPNRFRNVILSGSDSPILVFADITDSKLNPLVFEVLDNGTTIPLENMEYYEYGVPDVYNGGKLTFFYNYLHVVMNYIIHPNSSVTISSVVNGMRPDGKPNLELSVTQGKQDPIILPLETSVLTFPGGTADVNQDEIKAQFDNLQTNWEKTSNKLFSSGQQQIPKAYLELVQSAYSFVANSFNIRKSVEMVGIHRNFTYDHPIYSLSPHSFSLNEFDDQVFGLITLSKLDTKHTLLVLKSWINTVNELGYMGNQINDGTIVLSKIQAPLLFQLIKELIDNPLFQDELRGLSDNLELIAENTWENSIGSKGLEDVKWLGNSNGIFGLQKETPKDSSSFQLLCLLGDMCRVMQKLDEKLESSASSKWEKRFIDVETAMVKYWNAKNKIYGDLVKGNVEKGSSSHVPVIIGLLKETSDNLKQLLENLQQDPNFLPFGLQSTEDQGVRVGVNYLLIQSLKKYSGLSGPSQELAHKMYSILKNHLAAVIARSNRVNKSFYRRYDRNMQPLGRKGHPEGALVFNIMSSL